MPEPTTPQLTESDVERIAARKANSYGSMVNLSVAERDALIRDWRALKVSDQHHYELWLSLKERHRHWFSDTHGAWADTCRQCGITTGDDHDGYDCIAWLQRQNAALREQLAEAIRERDEARRWLEIT